MMLIIGNPTNIYLASSANIDFISFFNVMFIPTICAGIIQLIVMLVIFNKSLKANIVIDEEIVNVKSKLDLTFGLIHLSACLILLVMSSYIHLDMWLICILCAFSLIVCIVISHFIRHKNMNIISDTT